MFCKKCGKEISDDSEFCQYCGEKQKDALKAYDEEMKKFNQEHVNKDESKMPSGCFIPVAIFLILLFIIMLTPEKPIEEDDYAQELLARTLCQQAVTSQLKNPKSAEFARGSETTTQKVENMKYNVYSYVYAQNSYGGTVKNDYACYVELTGKDTGNIKKLEMR